ncbi:cytochrome c biogenesis CcdA family protein [Bordetella sp. BOR01]|uniref:cytochrome c biogenesis CcdA family protein n=1 Tax=Bordetella sp. BOR01 TaxID=2854779 RepID=UPI001C45AD0E|nr:cytochrome c biogenesis CcdA family protein [Bordetella sp. BOR01]MBV7483102.1 cytochrome c biogenesis CcdA family protein [Bordetella sp. BOR01]
MDLINAPIALLAGVLTIASPCVLPLLPILLGSSVERSTRLRPLFVVTGFVTAFAGLGIALSLLSNLNESVHQAVRSTSIALLVLFGLARIWPRPYDWLIARIGGPLQRVALLSGKAGNGNAGGFLLGLSLGAVWTPCAGPVLASILVLAAKAQNVGQSSTLLMIYAIGAGIPMLAIAYGGKAIASHVGWVTRHTHRLQQGFGLLLVLTALAIHFQYDILAYAWIANLFL